MLALQEQQERFDKVLVMRETELAKTRAEATAQVNVLGGKIVALEHKLSDCQMLLEDCQGRLTLPQPTLGELRASARFKHLRGESIETGDVDPDDSKKQ
jgi:hypothetical protein